MDSPLAKGRWDSSDEEEHSGDDNRNRKKAKKINLLNVPETEQKSGSVVLTCDSESRSSESQLPRTDNFDHLEIVDEAFIGVQQSSELEIVLKEDNDIAVPDNIPIEGGEIEIQKEKKEHIPLFHGCRSVDAYQRVRYIDQGTYGMVYAAKCKDTGQMYALKQVKMGKDINRNGFPITALRETNILLALSHPNIVNVREMVIGSSTDKVYMVMEYMDNDLKSCLEQLRGPLPVSEVKQLFLQLLSAVHHMHSRWYIHRDLKTSNLLYSNEGKLCVCDFGMARKYGSPLLAYTFEVITLWYRPPELLLGQRVYSTAVDMWSCGCILAELLTRKPLFPGQGEVDQLAKIFRVLGTPTEHTWPGLSKLPLADKMCAKHSACTRSKLRELFPFTSFAGGAPLSDLGFDLLSRLLSADPKQRISASDAVNHAWFAENPLPTPIMLMPKFKTLQES